MIASIYDTSESAVRARISETGKSTYNVEYKLSKHWALVGEYDQFNAFNVGLKWKIYSK